MQNTPFTPRNVAKFAAKLVVYTKTAQATENVMVDYTRFEEDDLVVDFTGSVVGWYISDKLKPVTDKMVDAAADFIVAKREARTAKKETEKNEQ